MRLAGSPTRMDLVRTTPLAGAPFTLAIDIGGTNIKASVLNRAGLLITEHRRSETPRPGTPETILACIATLVEKLPRFDRVSAGFPGVVKGGKVLTAPNLGSDQWAGYQLVDALANRFGAPTRILNDAEVQGLGVVEGPGLECTITLGTGIGCALFRNRNLLLHLEIGQHLHAGDSYDRYIGDAARRAVGTDAWNERVRGFIPVIFSLTACDFLYLGGGNARHIAFALPKGVKIVSNSAGVTGGVRLWEPELDELFTGEPNAQWFTRSEGNK
jgi:polyphosphate glucokinase